LERPCGADRRDQDTKGGDKAMKKKIVLMSLFFVVVAVAQANPPTLYFSGLMSGLKVSSGAGYLVISKMWGSNLPEAAAEGKIVVSKEGQALYNFIWTVGTEEPPDTEINVSQAKDPKTGEHIGEPTLTEPGNYTLEFFAEDKKFYSFPFKISKLESFVFLEGAWNDWGYIFYSDGDPMRELEWKIWLRNYSTEDQKIVKVSVEIVRDKDQKLICSAMPSGMTKTLFKEWNRYEFKLINPPGHPSGEQFTKAKYLLESDGAYTLTMKIAGQLYGVWKFNVKGGKLEYSGRTLRGKADPLSFIYGGDSSFWYEKQK
jgi:hypothetical protein